MQERQLELDLWGELEVAERLPQQVQLGRLLEGLDAALLPLSGQQRLLLAGEAIGRIVSVCQLRAEGLLLAWEERYVGAQLTDEWLAGLLGNGAQFNLAAYEAPPELPKPPKRSKSSSGARVRYLSKAEAIAQMEREQARMVEEIVALAHDEGVQELEEAIALLLREWGGDAGLCEVAGGRAIAVLLVTLLSSELTLVCVAEGFYLSLDCLRIQLQQRLCCEAI